jgi:intein/homing endonuclease
MTGIASGAMVTMIDGNDKQIEQVVVGDDVLAYDFDNKRVMFGKVTSVKKSTGESIEIVTAQTKVVAAPDHLFFISENQQMKIAGDLQVGDEVLWFDLFHGRKEKVLEKKPSGTCVFYDFVVADYENFIANALIVSGK